MAEKLEELQLPRAQVEIESRGAIYAVPFFEDTDLGKPSQSPEDALGPGARHPPLATSVSSGHPHPCLPFSHSPGNPRGRCPHLAVVLSWGAHPPWRRMGGQGQRGVDCPTLGRSSSQRMEVTGSPGEVRGT